jgi:DNA recombination protein RmuC
VAKVREQVQKAADTLDRADTRSKQMRRVLKGVEALPEAEALARLPLDAADAADAVDGSDIGDKD